MIRVVHLINDLDRGGAETVLYRLLAGSNHRVEPVVISLTGEGVIGNQISELGIPIQTLNVSSALGYAAAVPQLRRALRRIHPDIVQTWMYHADLFGGIAAKTARVPSIAWGIHATIRPRTTSSGLYRAGIAAAARLSHRIPDRIICCSHEAARAHERIGYAAEKIAVVVNGFEAMEADPSKRAELRGSLKLGTDALLVGSIGRYHPDKDHATFLQAAARLTDGYPTAHFLLVGDGLDAGNTELSSTIRRAGLSQRVHLLGPSDRMTDIYSGLDLVVCSSVAEALPLTLGEAMGMGIPVVTTDVGDAGRLLSDPDRVVPPAAPAKLADAIAAVLDLEPSARIELGRRDRDVVMKSFNLKQMVDSYLDVYQQLAGGS